MPRGSGFASNRQKDSHHLKHNHEKSGAIELISDLGPRRSQKFQDNTLGKLGLFER